MCQICGDARHQPAPTRRRFLKSVATASLLPWAASQAWAADPPKAGATAPNSIAPGVALKRLMDGNARYAANKPVERDFTAGRAARVLAQHPIAAILSCADSRVAPELAFDQGPGDLFVVRVAGNFVAPSMLASLEYGVRFLGVPLIMVLGHTNCGAVGAAIKMLKDDALLPGHLPDLVRVLKPAVIVAEKTQKGNLLDNAIAENVRRQVAALKAATPIVDKAYAGKQIDIVGGVYDLPTGRIALV